MFIAIGASGLIAETRCDFLAGLTKQSSGLKFLEWNQMRALAAGHFGALVNLN